MLLLLFKLLILLFKLPLKLQYLLYEPWIFFFEMQLKLLNVARASLKETREDFEDYIKSRHLLFYRKGEDRYDRMLSYCRYHNKLEDYEPVFSFAIEE